MLDSIKLDEEDIVQLRKEGVLHIRGTFTKELIEVVYIKDENN